MVDKATEKPLTEVDVDSVEEEENIEVAGIEDEAAAVQDEAVAVQDEAAAVQDDTGAEDVVATEEVLTADPAKDEAQVQPEGAAAATEEGEPAPAPRPEGTAWYVVHSYSGYENKVKKNLEHRIVSMGMEDRIFQVVVPTEEEVELRDGQRRTTERRVFPGYILVEMLMDDDTWYVVRNTPGVTDFVRTGEKPVPLREEEVDRIIRRMEADAPRIKVSFKTGQKVRIIEGPFEDFMGTVDAIDTDHGRVRVLVSMFGRETPVEVDFLQVERV